MMDMTLPSIPNSKSTQTEALDRLSSLTLRMTVMAVSVRVQSMTTLKMPATQFIGPRTVENFEHWTFSGFEDVGFPQAKTMTKMKATV